MTTLRLLDALRSPNPTLDTDRLAPGNNTRSTYTVVPETWVNWADFNYNTLTQKFRTELESTFQNPPGGPGPTPRPGPLRQDLIAVDEPTIDDILRRFVCPVVNHALQQQRGSPYLGRGALCELRARLRPDFSANSLDHGQRRENILPGDTKVSTKWYPRMREDPGTEYAKNEWKLVVGQVATYMATNKSRYGFIVTDECLVALRLRLAPPPPPPSSFESRPVRKSRNENPHYRDESGASAMSIDSTFSDSDPLDWAYNLEIERAIIPWNAAGPGKLTIKLALWCLVMLANEDHTLSDSYPPLINRVGVQYGGGGSNTQQQGYGSGPPSGPSSGPSSGPGGRQNMGQRQQYGQPPAGSMPGSQAAAGQTSQRPTHRKDGAPSQGALRASPPPAAHRQGSSPARQGAPQGAGRESSLPVRPAQSTSSPQPRVKVTIKKHTLGGGLYMVYPDGKKQDTDGQDWVKVSDGYEYRTQRYTFWAKSLK